MRFPHQVPQDQHPQPHGRGIIVVRPRNMNICPAVLEVIDQSLGMSLDLELAQVSPATTQKYGGNECHRQYRDGGGNGVDQLAAKLFHGFTAGIRVQQPKIDLCPFHV